MILAGLVLVVKGQLHENKGRALMTEGKHNGRKTAQLRACDAVSEVLKLGKTPLSGVLATLVTYNGELCNTRLST